MKNLLIIYIIFSSICSLYSQNKTIKGKVIDDNLEILPYVQIVINDTIQVGKTDLGGFFQINIPISVKKILFRYVGVDTATIELEDKCDKIEVVMMLSCTCDFMSHKKIDRLRMKSFKKLSEIHKEAFKKGMFETEFACYNREFEPIYHKHEK